MHDALKEVIETMVKQWDLRLTAVHLVDSHLCSDPNKYLSALLLSLSTMLHLELPHINVLSKMDLLERCRPPPGPLSVWLRRGAGGVCSTIDGRIAAPLLVE